jgi:hypothetical protein
MRVRNERCGGAAVRELDPLGQGLACRHTLTVASQCGTEGDSVASRRALPLGVARAPK